MLNMIKVYGKPIRVNKASQDKRTQDVGANLFIGNLDPEVDEKVCSPPCSAALITCVAHISRTATETDLQDNLLRCACSSCTIRSALLA